ncbi:MAG: hypothetical protein CMB75_04895 [Euryarchaeota archaeon]|nr:hypothetical protein [Euryarchaeota archaeon]
MALYRTIFPTPASATIVLWWMVDLFGESSILPSGHELRSELAADSLHLMRRLNSLCFVRYS